MSKTAKTALIILASVVVLAALILLLGEKKHQVAKRVSDDGKYTLTVYEIGEAKGFNSSHCEFVLEDSNNKKHVKNYYFDISNDGGRIGSDNFSVDWTSNEAAVTVCGCEQFDTIYHLDFSGDVSVEETELRSGETVES